MKILFFGRGVVSTQYAWAFENAGHTVEFYVREGRKTQYGSYVNLEIWDTRRRKKDQIVKEKWPMIAHEEIKENHDYDLIFVSVNPEQISSTITYLTPRVGNATVLFIGNYWQDIQKSVHPLPLRQVVWGFPGCGGGFEGNSLYGGLYKTVHFGTFESQPTKRDLEVHNLFTGAGFKVVVHKNFQSWLMNHYALNTAMEVEVLKSGSFQKVISSPEALAGLGHNIREIIPVLEAKGIKPDTMSKVLSTIPPRIVGFLMSNIVYSPKSMPYAIQAHNHYKVGYAVQEMISEARKYGILAPRLYEVEGFIAQS